MKLKIIIICAFFLTSCIEDVEKYGKHYQKFKDLESLKKATALINIGVDTTYVKNILGEPIDFGFDYRYITDSIGENGGTMGAVFGIDGNGKVTWKDVFEISE